MKIKIHQCKTRVKFPFNIFALLIMYFQNTNYSHYSFSFVDETDDEMVVDATIKTVRIMKFSRFVEHYKIIKTWELEIPLTLIELNKWINERLGLDYSILQIIGLALVILKLETKNIFKNSEKRYICSELVTELASLSGKEPSHIIEDMDLNDTEDYLNSHFTFNNATTKI